MVEHLHSDAHTPKDGRQAGKRETIKKGCPSLPLHARFFDLSISHTKSIAEHDFEGSEVSALRKKIDTLMSSLSEARNIFLSLRLHKSMSHLVGKGASLY